MDKILAELQILSSRFFGNFGGPTKRQIFNAAPWWILYLEDPTGALKVNETCHGPTFVGISGMKSIPEHH